MGGPTAISYQEIRSWAELYRKQLESWEVDAIRAVDLLFLESFQRQAEADRQREDKPQIEIARR